MFGSVVRWHRRRLGLTQEELAVKAGLNVRSIGNIEAGRTGAPRPGTVRLLADAFGLDGDERDEFRAAAQAQTATPTGIEVQSPVPADGSGRAPVPAPPVSGVPAQLPHAGSRFTGRTRELAHLDALARQLDDPSSGVVITTIAGTAGVGKTALALHWAHRSAARFPDGQLYVNLRGFGPDAAVMSPAEAIRGFLEALGVAPPRIPTTAPAQEAMYRSLVAGRCMLVVLDNARDADHVRPMLPGAGRCLVLVTSRNQLPGLVAIDGAHPIQLDLLTVEEARDLLLARIGDSRPMLEPGALEALDDIISVCAHLPLALAIAAARAAIAPRLTLATLADRLRGSRGELDGWSTNDSTSDIRAVLSWSYRALTPDAARLFRLLALHPGLECADHAAASLAGTPLRRTRSTLAELTAAHLLSEPVPGRFGMHELLRAYARERLDAHPDATDRHAALLRVFDHYRHTAQVADALLHPHRDAMRLPEPQPGVTLAHPPHADAALDWCRIEHGNIMASFRAALSAGLATVAWHLARSMATYFDRQGHHQDWVATHEAVLGVADLLVDATAEAHCHRGLAGAYGAAGRTDEARTHLHRALHLYQQLGDQAGQAHTEHDLARLAYLRGDQPAALRHSELALRLYRAAGHRGGEANALNAVGWCLAQVDRGAEALDACNGALALLRELGDRQGEAAVWDSLGYVHLLLGQWQQATGCYETAVSQYRELGDRPQEADTLDRLGDAWRAAGEPAAARQAWLRSLEIWERLAHPGAAALRDKLNNSEPGDPRSGG